MTRTVCIFFSKICYRKFSRLACITISPFCYFFFLSYFVSYLFLFVVVVVFCLSLCFSKHYPWIPIGSYFMFGIPRADNNFESTKILGRLVANSNLPMSIVEKRSNQQQQQKNTNPNNTRIGSATKSQKWMTIVMYCKPNALFLFPYVSCRCIPDTISVMITVS